MSAFRQPLWQWCVLLDVDDPPAGGLVLRVPTWRDRRAARLGSGGPRVDLAQTGRTTFTTPWSGVWRGGSVPSAPVVGASGSAVRASARGRFAAGIGDRLGPVTAPARVSRLVNDTAVPSRYR